MVELPYQGDDIVMDIVLPNQAENIYNIASNLDDNFDTYVN